MKKITVLLFALFCIVSFSAQANDSLKVKKVRFFIEPKAIVYAPIQKSGTDIYPNQYGTSYVPYPIVNEKYTRTIAGKNNTTLNFGLSAGMSVRLNKYLYYQLSIMYYHIYQSAQSTQTLKDSAGKYASGSTYTQKASVDFIGINNGLTFRIKNILFTNSFMIGPVIHSTYKNTIQESTPSTGMVGIPNTCSCVENEGDKIILLAESKIGYSFLNNKIEPSIGIILSPASKLSPLYNQYNAHLLMFSASVKINL